MANFPNRCQHIKVNGTQCGSPALRRNRFCYFHKLYQDERIKLSADRARRGVATFVLPVLEDANSIQIALMQVIRLLVSQQIDHKTASLLLYALQTASVNLRLTRFDPNRHDVVLDPRTVGETLLNENVWEDDDFEDEEEEDEAEAAETAAALKKEAARKQEAARKKQDEIQQQIAAVERRRAAQLEADRQRRDDQTIGDPLSYCRPIPPHENPTATVTAGNAALSPPAERKPPSSANINPVGEDVREQVRQQIRKSFFPNGVPKSHLRDE